MEAEHELRAVGAALLASGASLWARGQDLAACGTLSDLSPPLVAVDLCHIDLHPRVSSGAKVSNGSGAERLLAKQVCLLLGNSVNVGLVPYLKFDDER